jgi:glycosyltransferase involved in cell wall biosynthesis
MVLCLSSTPESFGRTVAEALSIGTPVVGYNHGGVAEILAAEFPAGAVEFQDFEELSAVVRQLLSDPGLYVPVINRFEKSVMQEKTIRLYEAAYNQSVLSRRP